MHNVLGINTFCPWIEENVLHPRTHDLVSTTMFVIQVHIASKKKSRKTVLDSDPEPNTLGESHLLSRFPHHFKETVVEPLADITSHRKVMDFHTPRILSLET